MVYRLLTILGIFAALSSAESTLSVAQETGGGAGRAGSYGNLGNNTATGSPKTEDKNIGGGGIVGESSGAAPNGHSSFGNVAGPNATGRETAPGTTDKR
jgi:hypothetical protein